MSVDKISTYRLFLAEQPLDLPSVSQLQDLLRSKFWDETVHRLEDGLRNEHLGKKLEQLILRET